MITILDGPMGTELAARGVPTDGPAWSATAIDQAAETIAAIHAAYARAGATVHTANTFRTQRRTLGPSWRSAAQKAVRLACQSVPEGHRVAGSLAPLEDCYRPDLSPGADAYREHRELAEVLLTAGCDLLLCETHPQGEEAIAAVHAATDAGSETWLALTAGPDTSLLTPAQMATIAQQAVQAGASAILVNCTPATDTLRFVKALAAAKLGVPIGAYANAGRRDDALGWEQAASDAAERYARFAKTWIDAGATLVGGCCGTGPQHIARLRTVV